MLIIEASIAGTDLVLFVSLVQGGDNRTESRASGKGRGGIEVLRVGVETGCLAGERGSTPACGCGCSFACLSTQA